MLCVRWGTDKKVKLNNIFYNIRNLPSKRSNVVTLSAYLQATASFLLITSKAFYPRSWSHRTPWLPSLFDYIHQYPLLISHRIGLPFFPWDRRPLMAPHPTMVPVFFISCITVWLITHTALCNPCQPDASHSLFLVRRRAKSKRQYLFTWTVSRYCI